jgi:hypothetical protein
MLIWVFTIGEPINHKENKLRLQRSGLLTQYISENTNHKVVWWTSLFNHFTKKFEFENYTEIDYNSNLKIKCIKGFGYKKNISLQRVLDHYMLKLKIKKEIKNQILPDIIISSYPTLGICEETLNFAKENNIPFVIDYRDMWPEVFYDLFPRSLRIIPKIIFYPMSQKLNRVLKNSNAIVSVTKNILDFALARTGGIKSEFNHFFPLGYKRLEISTNEISLQSKYWKSQNIYEDDGYIKFCFFGTIGYQCDFETLIKAFNILSDQKIKLVICGSGDKTKKLKKLAEKNDNIILPGFMNHEQLTYLMKISDFGLCPQYPEDSWLNSIPGKAIQYMSEGLPILTSLDKGLLGNLVNNKGFGLTYKSENLKSLLLTLNNAIKDSVKFSNKKNKIVSFYEQNFDNNIVYKNYTNFIENLHEKHNL